MITSPTPSGYMSTGDVYYELGPNYSSQEREVTQALMTATIPGDVIRETVRPPIPGIESFPPRFGYPGYTQRQPDIYQVLDTDRSYPNRRDALSGGVAGWQGAARNVQVAEIW